VPGNHDVKPQPRARLLQLLRRHSVGLVASGHLLDDVVQEVRTSSTSCPIPKRGLSAGSRPPRSSKLRSRQISQSTARFCCCPVYGDPADRLLIATARQLSMPISMRDRQIAAYAAAGLTGEVALVLRNL
jgi:hypothetical protein